MEKEELPNKEDSISKEENSEPSEAKQAPEDTEKKVSEPKFGERKFGKQIYTKSIKA